MIAPIVTLGFGSFGSVNLLPTLGYGIGDDAPVTPGRWRVVATVLLSPRANYFLEDLQPPNQGNVYSTATIRGPVNE